MITLPSGLEQFMKGKDLKGLKPFAYLFRNKWIPEESESDESGDGGGYYALDTANPIDISGMILKPNTLSMTLDVNEVAQYNANNVTLSLSDTKNQFVEGTPESYFPAGYQLYGSKVVLYYGITSPINPYPTQVGYTVVGSPTITTEGVASNFSLTSYCLVNSRFAPSTSSWEINISFDLAYPGSRKNVALINSTLADFVFPKIAVQTESSTTLGIQACLSSNGSSWDINSGAVIVPYDYSKNSYVNLKYVPTTATTGNYILSFKQEGQEFTTLATYSNKSYIFQNPNDSGFSIGADIGAPANWRSAFIGSININETSLKIDGKYFFNGAHFFYEPQATPLFTGVIKDLPTYKPENYQVDLKLISPLEMLKDIEAKDFSDKVTGETLTYKSTDSDGHRIYWTTGTGVGGFDAVYADGVKLFEGIDFETDQLNLYGTHAVVTIINSAYYSATITADYYTWKTGLTVEQIVAGLVALGGYNSGNEDIRDVVWQTSVRTSVAPTALFTLGYTPNNSNGFDYSGGGSPFWGGAAPKRTLSSSRSIFPNNFEFRIKIPQVSTYASTRILGEFIRDTGGVTIDFNGFTFSTPTLYRCTVSYEINGDFNTLVSQEIVLDTDEILVIKKNNNVYSFSSSNGQTQWSITSNIDLNSIGNNWHLWNANYQNNVVMLQNQTLKDIDTGITLNKDGVAYQVSRGSTTSWVDIEAEKSNENAPTAVIYRTSDDGSTFSAWGTTDLGSDLGVSSKIIQFVLCSTNAGNATNFSNVVVYYLGSTLTLQLVNLSGRTVLEALQDFALISGYEFGVDRNGVFFFRPRVASTNPVYELGHNEVVKVDTVKKNFSDFFTKLTLTFAQVPLEFYANYGPRPTAVDKYGIINKDIDKPDIVNYDNPELAQAIGPQLLEVYSAFPDVIQVVGKLNLALELADIVNLKRNFNLVQPQSATDYEKYEAQQTYYRACKITGMNYNFAKKQITYTLRDVSNANNIPPINAYGFVYDLPIQLGKLKTE